MSALSRAYRSWYYGRKFVKCGKKFRFTGQYMEIDGHVEVGDHCKLRNNIILRTTNEGKIIFANRAGASYNVIIEATTQITIGELTGIAENTVIRDTNHLVHGTDLHWRYSPHDADPITIGDHCLIGSGCYIGPGVTIGQGAVIGHGSIVTKARPIGDYEIWAGAPARFISHRTEGVAKSVLKRNLELAAMHGVREDRYIETPKGPVASSQESQADSTEPSDPAPQA